MTEIQGITHSITSRIKRGSRLTVYTQLPRIMLRYISNSFFICSVSQTCQYLFFVDLGKISNYLFVSHARGEPLQNIVYGYPGTFNYRFAEPYFRIHFNKFFVINLHDVQIYINNINKP